MLKKKRSRRMPALLTTHVDAAEGVERAVDDALAASQSATLSALATASPPAAAISSTTGCAGPASLPSPATEAPMSLTTTFAPSRRQREREVAADAAAGAGDDDYLALNHAWVAHEFTPYR